MDAVSYHNLTFGILNSLQKYWFRKNCEPNRCRQKYKRPRNAQRVFDKKYYNRYMEFKYFISCQNYTFGT